MTFIRPLARGVALFFGLFSLANFVAQTAGSRLGADLWWVDLRVLPARSGAVLGVIAALLLAAYGVAPAREGWRRVATVAAAGVLAAAAVLNAAGFFSAWQAGTIAPGVPFPLSLPLAALFVLVGWAAWREPLTGSRHPAIERVAVIATVVLLGAGFPLAQVAFFGTTDYRRPADVAVVLGARVHESGVLSASLEDRVVTAVELYRDGLVSRLVMSGGVGESGIDEAAAMRDRAVSLGVPEAAVAIDSRGLDTDDTVRNTDRMIEPDERVLVVSQFYHLPRIKLAYRAVGREVYTVPAEESRPIVKTPLFVMREVPGFWVYWGRAVARDLLGR